MLHHLSIAVDNPEHVARVLTELVQGRYFPFPPLPAAYIVMTGDENGTAIEIAPTGTELIPGANEASPHHNSTPSRFTVTHAALSVPTSRAEIEEIAAREGWLVRYCSREGAFDVIELWVENHLLLELLTPEMSSRYTQFMTFDHVEALLKAIAA